MQRSIFYVAQEQRDKAIKIAMKRKEEFLGARVPKELRNRVIERANELGIPVSILIRNILEEAFRSDKPATAVSEAPVEVGQPSRYSEVLAWEKIILNKVVTCHQCNRELTQGSNARFGIGDPKGRQIVLCEQCSSALM